MSYNRSLSPSENAILSREPREGRGTKSQLVPCRTDGCKGKANKFKASGLCFDCIHFCAQCGATKPRGEVLCVACGDGGAA